MSLLAFAVGQEVRYRGLKAVVVEVRAGMVAIEDENGVTRIVRARALELAQARRGDR